MDSGALFEKVVRLMVSSCISSIIVIWILKNVRPWLFSNGMPEGSILVPIILISLCWGYCLAGCWEKAEGIKNG